MPPIEVASTEASALVVAMSQEPGMLTIRDTKGTQYRINSTYIAGVEG
jgi:hypothetical protein